MIQSPVLWFVCGLMATSLFYSAGASSKTVYKSGDWILDDSEPESSNSGICRAVTATRFSDRKIYDFTIQVDKSGQTPVQILIYSREGQSAVSVFATDLGKFGIHYFSALAYTEGSKSSFWSVPTDTPKIIEYIQRFNQLNIQAIAGASGELPFSLRGSSKAVTELMSRCAGQTTDSNGFESEFLKSIQINVNKLNEVVTEELKQLYTDAYVQYLNVLNVKTELEALENRFQVDTKEHREVSNEVVYLSEQRIPQLEAEKKDLTSNISYLKSEVQRLQSSLPDLNNRLTQARQNYQKASENLEPFVAEHDRLLRQLRNANSQLSRVNGELRSVNNQLSRQRQSLSQLESQLYRLNSELDQKERELNRAQIVADRSQNQLDRFRPQQEIKDRVQKNRRLADVRQKIQSLRPNLQSKRLEVKQARQRVSVAEQALRQCQAGRSTSVGIMIQSWIFPMAYAQTTDGYKPGQKPHPIVSGKKKPKKPKKPKRPSKPGKPAPPTPPPATNCSGEKAQLNQAKRSLNTLEAELQRLQRELNQLENEKTQIRGRIEQRIQQKFNQLQNQARADREQVTYVRNDLDRTRREIDGLRHRSIPAAQNRVRELESLKSSFEGQVYSAQRNVTAAKENFESFKRSVNYEGLKSQVNQTLAVLKAAQEETAAANHQIQSHQETIASNQEQIRFLENEIQSLHIQLDAAQNRKVALEEKLAPYNEEKQQILSRLTAEEQKLTVISEAFYQRLT